MPKLLAEIDRRLSPVQLRFALFLLLLAVRGYTLFDPPYWDALMGAFPQGIWLAHNGFDVARLLTREPVFTEGGPNIYPFSVYPLLVGALQALELAPTSVFLVLHLFGLAAAATTAAAVFAVARRHLPAPAGLVLALVFATAPLFQSLACQINMEMPLVACTALSFEALDRRRFGRASAWALAALAIKYTAIILIGANLLLCLLLAIAPRWCGLAPEAGARDERRRAWIGVGAHFLLFLLFVVEVALVTHYAKEPAFVDPLGGWKALFLRRLWTIPEYGLGILVFLTTLPLLLARMHRGAAPWIQVQCGVFLAAFLLFYGQYTNTLPRYFLQSFPFLLVWIALILQGARWLRVRAVLVLAVLVFHIVNEGGAWYPSRPSGWEDPGMPGVAVPGNDGYVLERSMEYRDDLRMNLALARALEEKFPRADTVVVANWPLVQLLALPELGYVQGGRWRTASPDNPLKYDAGGVSYWELYDHRTKPPKKRTPLQVVWALTPNTFSGPESRLLPAVDEVLARPFEKGRWGFLVRRKGWE